MRNQGKRDALLLAAMGLFGRKGYRGTGVADIYTEAQAQPGSLYHHFNDKEGLLLAVLETYRDAVWTLTIEPATRDVEGPLEKVFAVLALYRNALMSSDCRYGCPVGALVMELHAPSEAVRSAMAAVFQAWRRPISAWLAEAKGWAPDGLDADNLSSVVLALMQGGVLQARAAGDIAPFDASVRALQTLLNHNPPAGPGTLREERRSTNA